MTLPLMLLLAAAPVPQTWTFQTDGSPEVRVSNIEGEILIEGVDGNSILFEVLQEGGEAARRDFPVEVVQDGKVVRAQVCCGPCTEKRRSCNEVAKTHFRVKVPHGAELNLSSVNSAVKVVGVVGEQTIATVDGKVEVSGSRQAVSVSAVSGEVVLAPGEVAETSVSTVSGPVKLRMPKGSDAQLGFSSVGGSFNGQGTVLGGVTRKYGKGTHEVDVSTVSGSLQVQQD
jgi:Putative adhesin